MTSRFERVELLLGPEALARLSGSRVIVAGLGAVGATAAESLVRSGVGHLTVVDFDEIRLSNINRHPFAFQSTVGQLKTEMAARILRDIDPAVEITALPLFLDADTAPRLLAEHPGDVLIDAIDSLLPKTELLLAARQAGVPFILTCLGAARKTDPGRFVAADLSESHTCRLARHLRKRLGRRGGVEGIRCIFSTEPPLPPRLPVEPAADYHVRGRLRAPMGSLHAVTASAGLLAAREAIGYLLRHPAEAANQVWWKDGIME